MVENAALSKPYLQMQGVQKCFTRGATSTLALAQVDLAVKEGEFLAIGDAMKMFAVGLSAFLPVLTNTLAGVRSVDLVSRDMARTFQLSRTATVLKVELPASLPDTRASFGRAHCHPEARCWRGWQC